MNSIDRSSPIGLVITGVDQQRAAETDFVLKLPIKMSFLRLGHNVTIKYYVTPEYNTNTYLIFLIQFRLI